MVAFMTFPAYRMRTEHTQANLDTKDTHRLFLIPVEHFNLELTDGFSSFLYC